MVPLPPFDAVNVVLPQKLPPPLTVTAAGVAEIVTVNVLLVIVPEVHRKPYGTLLEYFTCSVCVPAERVLKLLAAPAANVTVPGAADVSVKAPLEPEIVEPSRYH